MYSKVIFPIADLEHVTFVTEMSGRLRQPADDWMENVYHRKDLPSMFKEEKVQ